MNDDVFRRRRGRRKGSKREEFGGRMYFAIGEEDRKEVRGRNLEGEMTLYLHPSYLANGEILPPSTFHHLPSNLAQSFPLVIKVRKL